MSDGVKEFVSWMGIIGIPSIFSISMWCAKKCWEYAKKLQTLAKAQQAQMRSQLMKDYYTYLERGYIYEFEAEDWENCYQSYHMLGKNGIMDARREKLLQLPTKHNVDN